VECFDGCPRRRGIFLIAAVDAADDADAIDAAELG